MGKIVQLFKKVPTDDEAKSIIIDNLKNMHHCKWVNIWCAIRGIDNIEHGHKMLNALIEENKTEIHFVSSNSAFSPLLYRYNSFSDLID